MSFAGLKLNCEDAPVRKNDSINATPHAGYGVLEKD